MGPADIHIRRAVRADLDRIVALIEDDDLGRKRETAGGDPAYAAAFAAIERNPNQLFAVATAPGDAAVIGCFQLSFIPGLSRRGLWRGQIETVRIARELRGQGLGRRMMEWAIAQCRARGCGLVQLTTDKSRSDAHRFYAALGFAASHEGMKLIL